MVASSMPRAEAAWAAARALATLNAPPRARCTRWPRQVNDEPEAESSSPSASSSEYGVGRDGGGVGEEASVGAVEVDDGPLGELGLEQAGLGLEVRLHRAVVVEVVAAEVGEHGHGEAGAVDPVQVEGVRRDLHGHDLDPVVAPAGQGALQVGGLRGGPGAREGAEHLGPAARGLGDVAQEVGGGGLAVGAGHPDDRRAPGTGAGRTRRPPAPWRRGCRAPAAGAPAGRGGARPGAPPPRRRRPRRRGRGRRCGHRARSRRARRR